LLALLETEIPNRQAKIANVVNKFFPW
jgi:hypothetical protein